VHPSSILVHRLSSSLHPLTSWVHHLIWEHSASSRFGCLVNRSPLGVASLDYFEQRSLIARLERAAAQAHVPRVDWSWVLVVKLRGPALPVHALGAFWPTPSFGNGLRPLFGRANAPCVLDGVELFARLRRDGASAREPAEKKTPRPPAFKCGTNENARAWKLLVDEFFGGVDRVPACG
jgi:hypothetical protein